jgi:predicted nucleotidyltransferase
MDEHSILSVHSADIGAYRTTAQRQKAREQQALERRHKRAWDLARGAATLLREHFGASRVVVFGSLIHAGCFTLWSDVDIAAWGIAPHDTFRAIGAVHDLATEDMAVNLVDVGACRPTIFAVIEQEGVDL